MTKEKVRPCLRYWQMPERKLSRTRAKLGGASCAALRKQHIKKTDETSRSMRRSIGEALKQRCTRAYVARRLRNPPSRWIGILVTTKKRKHSNVDTSGVRPIISIYWRAFARRKTLLAQTREQMDRLDEK